MPSLAPTDLPLALLPVRIECRFAPSALRVRVFPDDVHVDSRDPREPKLQALPECWIVLGYQNDRRVFQAEGRPIPSTLPIAPGLKPGEPGLWLTDYVDAERVGMAVTIALPPEVSRDLALGNGIDLFVLGVVRGSGEEGEALLSLVLAAQQAGNGAGVLAIGMPTNNTDERPSTFDSGAPAPARDASVGLSANSVGSQVARALGLDPAALANFAGADKVANDHIAATHAALWPASWGYYLQRLMAGAADGSPVATPATLSWVRRHFIDHVRPQGPLPPLRLGKQPYGLLPVTSVDRWAGPPKELRLVELLRSLRDQIFLPAAARVPRVASGVTDPDAAIRAIFSMQPEGAGYRARALLGRHYLRNLFSLMKWAPGETHRDVISLEGVPGAPVLDESLELVQEPSLPWTSDPRLQGEWLDLREQAALQAIAPLAPGLRPRLATGVFTDRAEDLTRPVILPEPGAEADRLRWLSRATLDELRARTVGVDDSLAFLMFRHALLLELAMPSDFREPELVDPAFGGMPLWSTPRPAPHADLDEVRRSLAGLAECPPEDLAVMLGGALDLSSHRLDAWITSFATLRLAEIRRARPRGIRIGAYGWVEGLLPRTGLASDGFLHAPSLPQAATAAVLRSGHQTHPNGALAIDLSSARVRLALELLDGLRAGQSLGALLGEAFERDLLERGLARYIQGFRTLAPLKAQRVRMSGAVESIAMSPMTDGLALAERWRASRNSGATFDWGGAPGLPPGPHDLGGVGAALTRLEDAIDALSDVLLAESVHHIVRGDSQRAGTTLDALSRGASPPAKLEIVGTPRPGRSIRYRMIALISGREAHWPADDLQVRARVEPRLEAWAARLLGDPRRVQWRAKYVAPGGEVLAQVEPSLDVLRLSALDVVASASDLEPFVRAYHANERPPAVPADAMLVLDLDRDAGWRSDRVSLAELSYLARSIATLLQHCRPLRIGDLSRETTPLGDDKTSDPDLDARAEMARQALAATRERAKAVLAATDPDPGAIRTAVRRLASFGIPMGLTSDRTELSKSEREAARRLAEGEVHTSDPSARLRAIFGSDFLALPSLSQAAIDRPSLAISFDLPRASFLAPTVRAAAASAASRAARVGKGAAHLDDVRIHASALGVGADFELYAGQSPRVEGEPWFGLPLPAAEVRDRLVLIAHAASAEEIADAEAGLVVEEWVETVPYPEVTTGLALHYDRPGSRAPQAILLAVPPDGATEWDLEGLARVLRETASLARVRAVDPPLLDKAAHFLPALCFAFNASGDTVSTDFAETGV